MNFENKPISKSDPDRGNKRKQIEIEKRNFGLKDALNAGCNYFMTMDTDEFYDKEALISAKNKIKNNPIWTHTFVHIFELW